MAPRSDVADMDYLQLRLLAEKDDEADGVVTYNEVATFAGSSA